MPNIELLEKSMPVALILKSIWWKTALYMEQWHALILY